KKDLPISFATVTGRFYAMDRDKRWDRVQAAYEAMVEAKGKQTARTPDEAVDKAYAADKSDEFVEPTVIGDYKGMQDGDGRLMFNYRSARGRETRRALLDLFFDGFKRGRLVTSADAVGMVESPAARDNFLKPFFPPVQLKMGLGETIAR